MPVKLRRFPLAQPEDFTVDELCAKAANGMIVDRQALPGRRWQRF